MSKGMSTGLKVAVVAIVILIVAVVILGIFTGGIQRIAAIINSWLGGSNENPCETACNVWCTTNPEGETPYSTFLGCKDYPPEGDKKCKC